MRGMPEASGSQGQRIKGDSPFQRAALTESLAIAKSLLGLMGPEIQGEDVHAHRSPADPARRSIRPAVLNNISGRRDGCSRAAFWALKQEPWGLLEDGSGLDRKLLAALNISLRYIMDGIIFIRISSPSRTHVKYRLVEFLLLKCQEMKRGGQSIETPRHLGLHTIDALSRKTRAILLYTITSSKVYSSKIVSGFSEAVTAQTQQSRCPCNLVRCST